MFHSVPVAGSFNDLEAEAFALSGLATELLQKMDESRAVRYAALVMAPPAWLSTITGVSNQLISGSEP